MKYGTDSCPPFVPAESYHVQKATPPVAGTLLGHARTTLKRPLPLL
jgi:hypothetical protein